MDIVQYAGNGYQVEVLKKLPKQEDKNKIIVIQGGDDDLTRQALSSKFVDILLDPHEGSRRDFMHHRDSGLNQVLCHLAREHSIAVGFSLQSILRAKNRAGSLGRIMQNIQLCRKYKVRMVIGSFASNAWEERNEKDLQALFKVLGMTGKEVQMDFVEERLNYKRRYVQKGVMLAH